MTPNLPSPSVAPTSARECVDFSFSNLPGATVPLVDGATAALPGKHSQAVVTNFCPIKFNAALEKFAAGARRITDEQPAAGASAGAVRIQKGEMS